MARVPDVSRRAPRQCLLWALLLCAAGRAQANQEVRGGSTTNWPILVVGKIVGNCPHSSGPDAAADASPPAPASVALRYAAWPLAMALSTRWPCVLARRPFRSLIKCIILRQVEAELG